MYEYIENNAWVGVVNCLFAHEKVIILFIFQIATQHAQYTPK